LGFAANEVIKVWTSNPVENEARAPSSHTQVSKPRIATKCGYTPQKKTVVFISYGRSMPQLDLFSYFSAATYLILSFLILIFILHTYYLPKIATVLKFRKKMELKNLVQHTKKNIVNNTKEDDFLNVTQKYINEMEKITKAVNK